MVKETSVELMIDNLNSTGQGVARRGRDVYFVPGALVGERVKVRLNGRRKKVWQTQLVSIESEAEDRQLPVCAHYKKCGGCDLQHLSYQAQLTYKQQRVERELQRQGVHISDWQPPLSGPSLGYRRKARLGVRYSKQKDRVFVGFREAGSEHLTDVEHCTVLESHPLHDWSAWRHFIQEMNAKDRITQIETVRVDNGLAITLRSLKPLSPSDSAKLLDFVEKQSAECAVQLWIKDHKLEPPRKIWSSLSAPEVLVYQVAGAPVQVKPTDFLQVNAEVNRQMVHQAISWLAPEPDECVWDLFSGHGNFSLPLAQRSAKLVAVEGQTSMVQALEAQAKRMALSLHAVEADLFEANVLEDLRGSGLSAPDKLVLDPPRAGAASVVQGLASQPVAKVLYISCDPATLARDLGRMTQAGYQIIKAGIMDMFPQTHHVETMVLLSCKGKHNGKST